MAQTPSTPVKVPSSAADYTPATLDPDLRSQINTILLRDGHVPKSVLSLPAALLSSSQPPSPPPPSPNFNPFSKSSKRLLHALNADSSNWPTVVQDHALQLLRSGEVITFPALLRRVLDDIREASSSATTNGSSSKPTTNGDGAAGRPSLAVPQAVVEETIRVTKECLESVCEIED
ncbi:hypothetical protein ISF_01921 [Cordyceps fumosorosea ARSEF 2679]|uniref:Uncharacterized protein n=1 Tax=Cordyceps fumosorosea (strain ARSEF 2679) TaxID=1081104 RepID=A0A168CH40_CORFA|nr:hypothetical protein ISF_01921 [Cordyceps fumosorosea ARSEF 2679]OAA71370.1 hypothetical protein ISF_01921 [Cordyceps fumosorosea ARSEF 2679]